jgi:hypothetical protein
LIEIFIKYNDCEDHMQKNFGIPQNNGKLEEILDNKPKDRNDPKDGTKWLKNIFEKYFVQGYSYAGHGTSERCADSIMREGLYARESDLSSTTIQLCDCGSPAMGECIDMVLNWPHRNYKCIFVVAIPNPKPDEKGGLHYFNSVFEELEENKKIDIGIQDADKNYIIPRRFIIGYIDIENGRFVENLGYNPKAVVILKQSPGRTVGGHKGITLNVPPDGTEPEVF